ncbi:MAG: Hsp20/alpha crystallin family protein [Geminicoccaceae bacterium]
MVTKSEPSKGATSGFVTAPGAFRALQEEMDRMFHAFSMPQMSWAQRGDGSGGALGLRVDIGESEGEIEVSADLPGVADEDLSVTLEDDLLRIRAEKKSEAERTDKDWRVTERSYGLFERTIRVPAGIDPKKVNARFENGVLKVTLPKPADTQPASHKINVKKAA